jgi:hypothetical protein
MLLSSFSRKRIYPGTNTRRQEEGKMSPARFDVVKRNSGLTFKHGGAIVHGLEHY